MSSGAAERSGAGRLRIAVLGAGHIGATLGGKWSAAGHTVSYGVRTPDGPGETSVDEALRGAEVVVLAVPGAAAKAVVEAMAPGLAGTVVIDASNDMSGDGPLNALAAVPSDAHPVRAFNTLGWECLADPVVGGVRADMLFAASEGRGREVAEQLIAEVGLEPIWLGGPEVFDVVDSVTRLWFTLVFQRQLGRRLAFKVLRDQ